MNNTKSSMYSIAGEKFRYQIEFHLTLICILVFEKLHKRLYYYSWLNLKLKIEQKYYYIYTERERERLTSSAVSRILMPWSNE